jgi:hypothetical protein
MVEAMALVITEQQVMLVVQEVVEAVAPIQVLELDLITVVGKMYPTKVFLEVMLFHLNLMLVAEGAQGLRLGLVLYLIFYVADKVVME